MFLKLKSQRVLRLVVGAKVSQIFHNITKFHRNQKVSGHQILAFFRHFSAF